MAEWLRRLTRKPKVRTGVGSNPTLDNLVAVRNSSPGQPDKKKLPTADTVKLLGIQIDNKLKLNKHIHGLCSKVNQKVSAFARLNTYLSPDQATKICNTIIVSNFNYCPLVWLFCSDAANDEINRAHKRCLRILYQDYESSFQLLLSRDNSQTIHVKNLQKIMTEIYKSTKKLNPSYLWEFHERKEVTYDLRTKSLCKLPKIKKRYGAESLSFRGSFLWNTLSDKIKQSPSLAAFKNQIKSWTRDKCTCRLCLQRFYLDIYSTFCILSNSLLYSWNELVSCTRLNPTINNVNDDEEPCEGNLVAAAGSCGGLMVKHP